MAIVSDAVLEAERRAREEQAAKQNGGFGSYFSQPTQNYSTDLFPQQSTVYTPPTEQYTPNLFGEAQTTGYTPSVAPYVQKKTTYSSLVDEAYERVRKNAPKYGDTALSQSRDNVNATVANPVSSYKTYLNQNPTGQEATYYKGAVREADRRYADYLAKYSAQTGGIASSSAYSLAARARDEYVSGVSSQIAQIYGQAYQAAVSQAKTGTTGTATIPNTATTVQNGGTAQTSSVGYVTSTGVATNPTGVSAQTGTKKTYTMQDALRAANQNNALYPTVSSSLPEDNGQYTAQNRAKEEAIMEKLDNPNSRRTKTDGHGEFNLRGTDSRAIKEYYGNEIKGDEVQTREAWDNLKRLYSDEELKQMGFYYPGDTDYQDNAVNTDSSYSVGSSEEEDAYAGYYDTAYSRFSGIDNVAESAEYLDAVDTFYALDNDLAEIVEKIEKETDPAKIVELLNQYDVLMKDHQKAQATLEAAEAVGNAQRTKEISDMRADILADVKKEGITADQWDYIKENYSAGEIRKAGLSENDIIRERAEEPKATEPKKTEKTQTETAKEETETGNRKRILADHEGKELNKMLAAYPDRIVRSALDWAFLVSTYGEAQLRSYGFRLDERSLFER